MKKTCILFLILQILLFAGICSCSLDEQVTPDFSVSEPVFRSAEKDEAGHEFPTGVYFNFQNTGRKKIILLEIKMTLYDKKTKVNALKKQGEITYSFEGGIEPGITKELCVPLTDKLSVVSESELSVDYFNVSKIVFSDGSFWFDFFGAYAREGGIK